MWFKNIRLFRLEEPFTHTVDNLEKMMASQRFVPCAGMDLQRMGWVSVLGQKDGCLSHQIGDDFFFRCMTEKRVLPASVVNEEVAERVENREGQLGRTLSKKEKSDIKEDVLSQLIPQSFRVKKENWLWVNAKLGYVIVNASSDKLADDIIALFRKSVNTFPVQRFVFNDEIADCLTKWVKEGQAPNNMEIGEETELRDQDNTGTVIRAKKQDLGAEEIIAHLDAGKVVTSLALSIPDDISFIVDSDFNLKRIKLSDTILEENDSNNEDAIAQLDADLALMAGEYTKLIPTLIEAFGGEME